MSWSRAPLAKALVAAIEPAATGVSVFERPPFTLNVPAIVVSGPTEVRYSSVAFSIDEVILPIVCVAALDEYDELHSLIVTVRESIDAADPTLGGIVSRAWVSGERNWRPTKIAGADCLAAEAVLTVYM
jgi:hypothetical protein